MKYPVKYPVTVGAEAMDNDKLEVFTPHDGTQDLAWLQAHYGAGIQLLRSTQKSAFRLRKINIMTSGDTLIRIWAFDKNGQPAVGQPVTYTYYRLDGTNPDLPPITGVIDKWAPRGVQNKNRVDGTGKVEFQIGYDSWIKNGTGPYAAFVLSPSIGSDCLNGIGWLGGTNHEGPVELFFYEESDDAPPPPPDNGDDADVLEAIAKLADDMAALNARSAAMDAKLDKLLRHFTTV